MNWKETLIVLGPLLLGCANENRGTERTQRPDGISTDSLVIEDSAGVTPPKGGHDQVLHEGRAKVWVPSAIQAVGEAPPEGRWGYTDAKNELVVAARFKAAGDFASGRALVLLDDEYVLIDTAGTTREQLVDSTEIIMLPAPPLECSDLQCYVKALGGEQDAHLLIANPSTGEQRLELEVRKLGYGTFEVRERGWEGWSHVLAMPGRTPQEARELLDALLQNTAIVDVTEQAVFPQDILTYQLPAAEAAGEFYGVRVRGNRVEIHHTVWAS